MRTANFLFLLIVFCSGEVLTVEAQTAPRSSRPGAASEAQEASGMVRTRAGALIVSNVPGKLFTIEISGGSVAGYDNLEFESDHRFLKIKTVNKKELLSGRGGKNVEDSAVLGLQREQYGSSLLISMKYKPMAGPKYLKLNDGTDALWWSYYDPSIPEDDTSFTIKEYCLSTVRGDWVFLLTVSLTRAHTDTDEDIQQLLLFSMNSLKLLDKPLSLKSASQMVLQRKM
jgi:hypothetical protein